MLAESAGIIKACLCIPVAASPSAFTIRYRPGNAVLTEDFLTVDEGGDIFHSCTITALAVLLSRILRVVRTLGLEAQAFCKETQIKLVLKVEIEHVRTLVHVTEVIIIHECISVERSYEILV